MPGVSPPVNLKAPDAMDFPDATRAILDGDRVTRLAWNDRTVVIFLSDGLLKLRKADGTLHNLLVSDGDMQGTDWIVVREA